MKTIATLLTLTIIVIATSASAGSSTPKPTVGGCTYSQTCGGNPYRCVNCTTCCYGNQCNTTCN